MPLRKSSMVHIMAITFFLACAIGKTAFAQTITIEGDVWAPYVLDPAEGSKGFMVDVAEKAYAKAGYKLAYSVVPWTRSLGDVESGGCDAIVGIYFSQARQKKLILPAEELGVSVNMLFVKQSSAWKYTGIGSLDNMVLGTIADYDYGELNGYIAKQVAANSGKVQVTSGNEAIRSNLMKLTLGRVTVVVEDPVVVYWEAKQIGLAGKVKSAGVVKPKNPVGIAFSPRNPKAAEYAKILADGIKAMRKSGELKAILDKYGVADWK